MILNAISNITNGFKQEPLSMEMDEDLTKSIISQYNNMKLGADAFIETTNLSNESMKSYLHTVESGNATVQGYTQHINATNNSIGLTGLKAKAAAAGMALLNTALSMGVALLASFVIDQVVSAIDNVIHYEENLANTSENAKQNIEELKSSFNNLKESTDGIKERYAALAQGVDQINGKNLTLSNDEYEEFLDLSNQLSELFPSLTKSYDKNGNAILDLSGNVNTIVSSLNNLLTVEQELANQKILENLPAVYKELENEVSKQKDNVDNYEFLRNRIPKQSDINKYGKTSFSLEDFNGNIVDTDLFDYIEKQFAEKFKEYDMDGASADVQYNGITENFELGISGLEATEEYYENLKKIYEEIRVGIVGEIQEINGEIKNEMNSFNKYIYTWLSNDFEYVSMESEGLQTAIQEILYKSNWMDNLPKTINSSNSKQVFAWIKDNYLSAINDIEDEKYKRKISDLFTMDLTPQEKIDLANEIQAYFDENNIKISLDFITDPTNPDSEQNLADRMDTNISGITGDDKEGYSTLKAYTKDFGDAQINAWLEATNGAKNATDAIYKYEQSLKDVSNVDFFTDDNLEAVDNYKDKVSDLMGYLSSLETNGKLTAEEMAVLNTEYKITAESAEEYRNAIVALMNQLSTSSPIMVALKEAIESCNDATEKARLEDLYDSLVKVNSEAQESAYNVKDTAETLEDAASLLRELDEVIKSQGYIDTSSANEILDIFPEMKDAVAQFNAGLITSAELFELLEQAYQTDEDNCAKAIAIKNQYNEEYYSNWYAGLSDWIKETARSYGVDLDNYRNLNEAKLALDKEYARRKATLDSALLANEKALQIASESNNIRDAAASISAQDNLLAAQKSLDEMMGLINAVETSFTVDTSWKEFGKNEEKRSGGGSSGSGNDGDDDKDPTEIDWADQSLKVLQDDVDRLNNELENTHGLDNQLEAVDALNEALKSLKTGYESAYKEYKNRYEKSVSSLGSGIRKKIESGQSFNLAEYDSETGEKIEKAIENYNKMVEAQVKIDELTKEIDDNKNLEKSRLRQESYESELDTINEKLDNQTLTAKQKNKLLDEQLKLQNKINKELRKQAEYEENSEEVSRLKAEDKNNKLQNTLDKLENQRDENQVSIDTLETQLEDTSLTSNDIDDLNEDLEKATNKDFKYQFKEIIAKIDSKTWKDYIKKLKKKYSEQKMADEKFIKKHLDEISEHFDYTGMEKLYAEYLASIKNFDQINYDTQKNERSYYISDAQNDIKDIQNEIDSRGGRGSKEQFENLTVLYSNAKSYWIEQKKDAEEMLSIYKEGTAEWDKWNNEIQECENSIAECDANIKDCYISILKLPLYEVEDALREIENKLDDINDAMANQETYISAAVGIINQEIENQELLKEVIQEQIDALEEANEQRQIELALQRAEYALEKARNQRSEKIFHEGTGWVYESNQDDINSAQQQYDEALYNKKIYLLNEQIKVYDEEIERLSDIQEKWNRIASDAQLMVDITKALVYDGNFINKVLSDDLYLISSISSAYSGLLNQKTMYEAQQKDYISLQDVINDTAEIYTLEGITYEQAKQRIKTAIATYYPEIISSYENEEETLDRVVQKKLEDAGITEETTESNVEKITETNADILESYQTLLTDLTDVFEELNKLMTSFSSNASTMASSVKKSINSIKKNIDSLSSTDFNVTVSSSGSNDVKTAGKSHSGLELGYIGEGTLSQDKKDFKYLALSKLSDNEVVRVLQKGEGVTTENQVSQIMDNFRKITQFKMPTIIPAQTSTNQSVNFNGDIIVQGVQDTNSFAKAVKNQLPNAMLQQLYNNK